ncbi:molybdopterin-dependent oxidoreductase [Pseudosulfitobacter pseudonitzschiae]|uniref:molybdopterin-dependent oxidoreductase n=1 Tax=Pseudosulfitobacter pseudonitzschiae TaxID=1402135 RepID=UPI001AF41816|nr:molybdopterin-dependent oxidoreductase [Pseudosulfitobacter pseudonitzschiae]MBM1816343.1 oxidoreductase [Pseudosulfitobacter pseudonitzschiae]MBM1833856.1 oxidoreductase [Pseudosulfitobacter pseudonitzschiae]MBM1838722.1 oxidoreductase [Pseudosulfitobacter pseudonitzschiae]MBM1843070.1 oxidoreductase [Pseudosulfitobacter pseudonitzschiae]MBM1847936.1 oxidoreductase [Pseudosulfitobacter pseudonitzschiae]
MLRHITLATAALALSALPLLAQDLAAPEGDVILTVSGQIATTNVDNTAQFDLEMLEDLDATTFETSTIWSEGTQTFQGVSLKVLADRLGIDGATLRATAINDYAVDIPLTDAVEGGPIIAYKMDDANMSVRDKGPLWIVYPYDSDAAYRSEVIYSRSIWQLDRIEALD